MSERDNTWLHGYPAATPETWHITLCGFDATSEPPHASFLWPKGPELKIPNKMVLMTVAAYDALRAMPLQDHGWRPMETAPKDGAPFIYQDSDEAVSTCSWQADDCGYSWWDIAGDQIAYPVRWMPLPPVHSMVAEDQTSEAKS